MSQFGSNQPIHFLVCPFITRPSYQIEKFTFTVLVEFRVEDFGNLVFNVVINFNRRWWGCIRFRIMFGVESSNWET